jgi:lipid-A-disaccharide synthase
VVVVAGEASGDLHGANLINAIDRLCPEALFCGIGGDRMRQAGVKRFVASSDLAVVGLSEIFGKFRIHVKAANILKFIFERYRPDLLILIDYPGFNLYMARIAKKMKIPVLYYISPQVWAWRRSRVRKIARRVDKMAVILPFEKAFFQESGIDVEYVGHPLMDALENCREPSNTAIRNPESGIRNPIVGLVPGSRREEIVNLLPVMLKAGKSSKQTILMCGLFCPSQEPFQKNGFHTFLKIPLWT